MTSIIDPSLLVQALSSEEKIALLSGDDMWHTAPISRLGIPRARMSDGPNGVRGTAWTNGVPASCFPAATGIASSFDTELLGRVGEALGDECRARGVHCLLGPTTNIQRNPCGGRGFESYSEDPYLSGTLAAAWIKGVHSRKVMTCPKHWLGNEQEYLRRSNSSVVDERTLQELYIEPFRHQMKAKPSTFMSSYNRVNGTHVSESTHLLRSKLRGELGFEGMIMSDWSGTYSTTEAVKASLDLEMPGKSQMRGAPLERAVVGGKITQEDLDECVVRVLNFVKEAQLSGIPFEKTEESIDTPEMRSLLREAASASVVLLKNDKALLPITPRKGMKIAVVGPNANVASYSGGGSASLKATYTVSPLEAITKAAAAAGASVQYTLGADATRWTPHLTPFLTAPSGTTGVECRFFSEDPWVNVDLLPTYSLDINSSLCFFMDGIPTNVPVRGYISLRTTFVPDESGIWEIGLGVAGQADLYVDGKKLIDNSTDQIHGLLFFNTGTDEVIGELEVTAGRAYQLEVRFSNFKQIGAMSPYAGRRGGIRIGGRLKSSVETHINRAVSLSKESDVTILIIGTNSEWESESYDRYDIKLPAATDELVRAVLAVDPNTIVVNQSGMPVEFPWVNSASTIVQAFFGGNECGTAIADVVFGHINPSGKLPITWPSKLEDYPSHGSFGHPTDTIYSEGIYVGYRHFDRARGPVSAFPFGFGLSYTEFAYSDLEVIPEGHYGAKVSFKITNVGDMTGAESAQVYVHHSTAPLERPEIELKGYSKVVLAPAESKTVEINLTHEAWAYYCVRRQAWIGDVGVFEIRIGRSSREIVLAKPFHLAHSYTYTGIREPVGSSERI